MRKIQYNRVVQYYNTIFVQQILLSLAVIIFHHCVCVSVAVGLLLRYEFIASVLKSNGGFVSVVVSWIIIQESHCLVFVDLHLAGTQRD